MLPLMAAISSSSLGIGTSSYSPRYTILSSLIVYTLMRKTRAPFLLSSSFFQSFSLYYKSSLLNSMLMLPLLLHIPYYVKHNKL
ncbi:hypothetical protein D1T48_gp12 [Thermoproteus tenax virus 1]|uniref:Uncharacterized 9.4 kDa protein n=1 Tax=Thermoproteus tenax virus 1 (strain KRA1) TaxID=10480 RepID=YORC_TTV1K|nr:hypothetical protein D1T48_gp12 [Thermoproteus tenax virus 1]P19287.1 RecName: Full=Uncharacterized 9.4 kDa protein [Thermoproteus tenax virus 1 (STRAIN KRA1)]CAA32981.1 unnamed protein product [Thermoproteus tenax virus 1]